MVSRARKFASTVTPKAPRKRKASPKSLKGALLVEKNIYSSENEFTLTENGMKTLTTSGTALVDFFFKAGAMRGQDITLLFQSAYLESPTYALRLAAWLRDIRGGAGERGLFRQILKMTSAQYELINPRDTKTLIELTPKYGRFDDLLVLLEGLDSLKHANANQVIAIETIAKALKAGNGLAAKWMPRQGKIAGLFRAYLNLSPKKWRQLLVRLTKVVETQMCANEWSEINYSHVPSVAASRYAKAFNKHDATRYSTYREDLKRGKDKYGNEVKINASAIFPYDVVKSFSNYYSTPEKAVRDIAEQQWAALPNYVGKQNILPLVDTSGSMASQVSPGLSAYAVAISLGLYLAEKNTGKMQGLWMDFANSSKLRELPDGTLYAKYKSMHTGAVSNTNINAAFDALLSFAIKHDVPQHEMPKYILLLSDMEFDASRDGWNESAIEMINRKYKNAGYAVPNVVFWNIQSRTGQVPVKLNAQKVALVSGFSPAIVKSVLAAKNFTPYDIMMDVLDSKRYADIDG